jgi:hypothetical protein
LEKVVLDVFGGGIALVGQQVGDRVDIHDGKETGVCELQKSKGCSEQVSGCGGDESWMNKRMIAQCRLELTLATGRCE